jgi:hypothetical protein
MLDTQVGVVIDTEPGVLLKTTGPDTEVGDGDQDQGAEMRASLTAFSRSDRTVPDYGVYSRHLAGR